MITISQSEGSILSLNTIHSLPPANVQLFLMAAETIERLKRESGFLRPTDCRRYYNTSDAQIAGDFITFWLRQELSESQIQSLQKGKTTKYL